MTLASSSSSSSSHSNALQHLKNLSLRGLNALDDEVVHSLLSSITCANLEGLDLSNNVHLTDQSLSSIRLCNLHGRLKSLKLSGISNLTSAGLEAFFTFDIPQMPNPPALRSLDLSNCGYEAVNESVVNLAIAASALKRQPQQQNNSKNNKKSINNINSEKYSDNDNVSAMGGLISLDVSGGSVTDTNMETLAATCHSSLKELKLNFCVNVTDNGLGYLVDNINTQFSRLEIWGCAQITDSFLDGHSRVDEEGGGVDIVGVWMSKGNVKTAFNR
jgi:F-box/leucine-rich repeat protein 2/20